MAPAVRLVWEQLIFPGLLWKMGVDLLHSLHYTLPFGCKQPVVVTFHDMTFFLYPKLHTLSKRLFFRFMIPRSAHRADALIAVSENTRQDIIRLLGVKPDKIMTVPLGLAPAFRPIHNPDALVVIRQRYHLPERFILFVGLIEPRKNLPSLLRALRIAGQKAPCHLVVVGEPGWQVKSVYRLIQNLDLMGRVHFTGYVPVEDLPGVYNLADLLVYPSFYEGFGLPVLEAMGCGLPVIASNTASLPEITGEAGFLLPPGEDGLFAQAVLELLADKEARRRFSELGQQRAAAFTWQRAAQSTLDVYRCILEGRS